MKIIIFRHGNKQKSLIEPFDDKENIVLSPLGIEQIALLGNVLKIRFPELILSSNIYSSPYRRTIQSAEIVKNILNIKEISIIPEFQEFNPVKDYSQPKEIREHLFAQSLIDPNLILSGADFSLNQTLSNFENKLKEICSQNDQKTILISSHSCVVRNLVYSIDKKFRPSDELILESKIHEAGYTVLNFNGQNFSVDQFNVHDFLLE